jgi:cytochrome c oxidase subunit 2
VRVVHWLVIAWAGLPASGIGQPNLESGREVYQVCAGCHGFSGEGNALVGAPRLAGLQPWYLERQLHNFADGLRGGSGDDHGQRMAPMTRAAHGEREIKDLVAYVGTLPVKASAPTLQGDAAAGASRYAVCAACHGQKAEGNESLGAPALATLDDWYLVRQLNLYAAGQRGTSSQDTFGQQMRAISGTVTDPQQQRDLAAYIHSLAP